MSDETPRVPPGPGDVVREVRGLGGVPWRRLARYLRPHVGRFALALVGLVLSAGLGLLFPLLIAQITTVVVAGGEMAGLDRIVLLLIVLFSVQAVGSFLQSYFLGVVGERIVARMRSELFARLVTLSLDFHVHARVGELVSRLSSDVTQVRTMLTQTITNLLAASVGLVGSIVILFVLSPTLLLVVLAAGLLLVAAVLVNVEMPVLAMAAVLLFGVAAAPIYPLLVLTTAERTSPDVADRVIGFQAAASSIGSAITPGLIGLALGYELRAFGISLAALCVVAAVLLLLIHKRVRTRTTLRTPAQPV